MKSTEMYSRTNRFRYAIDGDTGVLLDVRTGSLWGLNPTSALLWNIHVENSVVSEDMLSAALEKEYGSKKLDASRVVKSFIALMTSRGAIEMSSLTTSRAHRWAADHERFVMDPQRLSTFNVHVVSRGAKTSIWGMFLALLLMLSVRLLMLCRFGWMYDLIERFPIRNASEFNSEKIDWAYCCVHAVAPYMPHQAMCIERSAVLTLILRAYRVPASFCFGCRLAPFAGHAWVEVNGIPINERSDLRDHFLSLDRV